MAGNAKEAEIRGAGKMRLLGTIAGWIVKIVGWTVRVRFVDPADRLEELLNREKPVIYLLWHNSVLGFMQASQKRRAKRHAVALTSASKDGAALEALVAVFGYGAVRGSSSRRGRAALLGLLKCLKEGHDAGITPDGPRGPRYVMQPGVIKVAQMSGAPIVPLTMSFQGAWRAKTWDRFRVPLPFSKLVITSHEWLEVPRKLDEAGAARLLRELEATMREPQDDLEPKNDDEH